MYKKLKVHITGVAPLIMHNGQLANPMNKWARAMKEITAKRKKTDDDLEELARLEFMGGLYVDDKPQPVIPGEAIEANIREGAKQSKKGKEVQRGVICDGNWPLIYEGPKNPDKLWDDGRFRDSRIVRVGQNRILRTRPIFNQWELKYEVMYLPGVINERELSQWIEAGGFCGLVDYRPRFGRFVVN